MTPAGGDLFPPAHWSELYVTFDDGSTGPLVPALVAQHWRDIEWFPRQPAQMRAWKGARLHRSGEHPARIALLQLRIDWGNLKTEGSKLRGRNR